jgi:hypothetical protein
MHMADAAPYVCVVLASCYEFFPRQVLNYTLLNQQACSVYLAIFSQTLIYLYLVGLEQTVSLD